MLTCSPDGYPNSFSAEASWTTDLFQPAVAVTKTGDAQGKIGDPVDYTITLYNNSSADTPDMICTATDTLLGEVFNGESDLDTAIQNATDHANSVLERYYP